MPAWVAAARALTDSRPDGDGVLWRACAGHYLSPTTALTVDAMMECLPDTEPERSTCLAVTIMAMSHCTASPGHTAQPFQPTASAARFIEQAWRRLPLDFAWRALADLCARHARVPGKARVQDAASAARELRPSDLAFIDPPYSGVQYSRFYHVLETVARGSCGEVRGTGRYPPPSERPASAFSRKSESLPALSDLLDIVAESGATAILTFSVGKCSNGLSGEIVEHVAAQRFDTVKHIASSRFSTLGGNNGHRPARRSTLR